MNLLCLSKRRPQQRDLLTRPYGRFFYLPKHLVEQSHEVSLLLLSYKNEAPQQIDLGGIHCYSESLLPQGPYDYFQRAEQIIAIKRPDWIIGFSDIWYGLAASYLGHKHGVRVLIDAYDNYESYIPWFKPLHWAWRKALRHADAVSAAGPNLADFMAGRRGKVAPMAADPIFQPMDRHECRRVLDLPKDTPLLGYCGSIHHSRNIDLLFDAFQEIRNHQPDSELVMTGHAATLPNLPEGVRIMGYLPDKQMPVLMNSLDVMVVMIRASSFGHYSYPAKLYEAMRCKIAVAASATDSVKWILRNHADCLFTPGDRAGLVRRVLEGVKRKRVHYTLPHENCWNVSGEMFERLLFKSAKNVK